MVDGNLEIMDSGGGGGGLDSDQNRIQTTTQNLDRGRVGLFFDFHPQIECKLAPEY